MFCATDGNTLTVRNNGRPLKIRLTGTDRDQRMLAGIAVDETVSRTGEAH